MNFVVGQMAELVWMSEGNDVASWTYMVANNIFDDRIEFLRKDNTPFIYSLSTHEGENEMINGQSIKSHVIPLYKDGKPVMSRKNFFGRYTFKPKN